MCFELFVVLFVVLLYVVYLAHCCVVVLFPRCLYNHWTFDSYLTQSGRLRTNRPPDFSSIARRDPRPPQRELCVCMCACARSALRGGVRLMSSGGAGGWANGGETAGEQNNNATVHTGARTAPSGWSTQRVSSVLTGEEEEETAEEEEEAEEEVKLANGAESTRCYSSGEGGRWWVLAFLTGKR